MTPEIQQKINTLRDKYINSSESQQDIDAHEKTLRDLFEEKAMAENPVFKKIAEDAQKRLEEINTLLLNDVHLNEIERSGLFKAREVWRFIFSRFGVEARDEAIRLSTLSLDRLIAQ